MATDNILALIKALSDGNRLKIFEMLMNGETCACKILENLEITQSTLSHHMRVMVDSGLVKARKDGQWMRYSIDETSMCLLTKYFDDQIAQCRSTGCKCKCGCNTDGDIPLQRL